MSITCLIWADWFLTSQMHEFDYHSTWHYKTYSPFQVHTLKCNSAYSIHPIFRNYDFIKDFWLKNVMFISSPTSFKMTPRSKVRDVSPRIYHSLWRGFRDVILRPEYVVPWYFSKIHKHCGVHRVALVHRFSWGGGVRNWGIPPSGENLVNSPPSDTCPRFWTKACPPPAEVCPKKFEKFKYIFVSNLTTFKLKGYLKKLYFMLKIAKKWPNFALGGQFRLLSDFFTSPPPLHPTSSLSVPSPTGMKNFESPSKI